MVLFSDVSGDVAALNMGVMHSPIGIHSTIDIENVGQASLEESPPMSPRRRKGTRGHRSKSFASIELFSIEKKD